MPEEFYIPKLGQTVEEVTIIRWLVQDGAQVKQGQEIVEVQTDKVVFPVEANADGFLHIGPYEEDDVVPVLTVVAIIGAPEDKFELRASQPAKEPGVTADLTPEISPAADATAQKATSTTLPREGKVFASPRARKLAKEKAVDLSQVTATGEGGVRIVEQDVVDYLALMPRVTPAVQKIAEPVGMELPGVTGIGPGRGIATSDVERVERSGSVHLAEAEVVERVPLVGVRGVTARHMAASSHSTAAVTLVMEVDASRLVGLRNRLKEARSEQCGFVPGYNELFHKIVAMSLRECLYMNARFVDDAIEYLDSINIGLAVDTAEGLLVPVIRDADKKPLGQLGTELRDMVDRARRGKSLPDDLTGGTFTITNLGMYDVDAFTPVINLPEAAILGVGRIVPKPVVRNGAVVVRHVCALSLTFDHRLIDGAPAARFLQHIKNLTEEPYLWFVT